MLLRLDWTTVLDPAQCTYVFGNPPFGGAKYQTTRQRAQVAKVAALDNKLGTLDYVAAWFVRLRIHSEHNREDRVRCDKLDNAGRASCRTLAAAFPQTQPGIIFAHRTFAWVVRRAEKSHVHVVIIGFALRDQAPKDRRIFDYAVYDGDPTESIVSVISPYLFNAANLGRSTYSRIRTGRRV